MFESSGCNNTVVLTATSLKKSGFISWRRSDFQIFHNSSSPFFSMRILTSLSVDEIWLKRYVNSSINVRVCNLICRMHYLIIHEWCGVWYRYGIISILNARLICCERLYIYIYMCVCVCVCVKDKRKNDIYFGVDENLCI